MQQVMDVERLDRRPGACFQANESVEAAFMQRFQQSTRACLRRGFTLDESFELIWQETLEEVRLPESSEQRIHDELRAWAEAYRRR